MNQKIAPLGVKAIDQAGTATGTWSTPASSGNLPSKGGDWTTACLQFGNITGLTFTLACTIDGVSKSPALVSDLGVRVAAGGTGTATDGNKFYFDFPIGCTAVTITAAGGSGNVELILMSDATAMNAAEAKAGSVTGVDSTLWAVTHVPAENVVATINKAAPGATSRLVVTGFSAIITTSETAPTAGDRLVTLTQDPAGTPLVLWNGYIGFPATAGATSGIVITNCNIPIATNKSVTLAFASAGGTDTKQTVNMNGRVESV